MKRKYGWHQQSLRLLDDPFDLVREMGKLPGRVVGILKGNRAVYVFYEEDSAVQSPVNPQESTEGSQGEKKNEKQS